MVNCPNCGASVKEEKAFCHNCGLPMNPSAVTPKTGIQDFGATIIEPTKPDARPFVTPAVAEVQPLNREPAPASPSPYGVALPSQPGAQPVARRKSRLKRGILFVLLLLFLMFVVFIIALLVD
jgi:hypothetical protein